MYQRTEQEIIQNWKDDINKPVVSICCAAYNHENFISEAIESFLMQETDFPFEVLINDDCSTDSTANIIRDYEKKYPNIIKPIYQKENRYSKGIIISSTFNIPRAKGKYIAFCEGDDYWTDKNKLQIQTDEMKKYPNIDLSFHYASELIDNKIGKTIAKHSHKNDIFSTSEVIVGGGVFMPTASLIIKKSAVENLPDWFYTDAPISDLIYQIFGSLNGALYINKNMSIYRKGDSGSWSQMNRSTEKKISHRKKMNIVFNNMISSLPKHKKVIKKKVADINFRFSWSLMRKGYIADSLYFFKIALLNYIWNK